MRKNDEAQVSRKDRDSQLAPRKVNIRKGNEKEGEEKSFPGFPPIPMQCDGVNIIFGLGRN